MAVLSSSDRIAIVTGASRGIGKEIARQLLELGWVVIGAVRNYKVASADAEMDFPGMHFIQLDLLDPNSFQTFSKELSFLTDRIDVLINNAGVIGNKRMGEFDLGQMREVMETNVFAAMELCKVLFPFLKKSKSGRIINMSSGMGSLADVASGGYAAYRLSKLALNGFTLLLAADYPETGIRVNAMCPGWVRTDMGGRSAPRSVEKGAETAVWLATEETIPNGKFFRDKKVISW